MLRTAAELTRQVFSAALTSQSSASVEEALNLRIRPVRCKNMLAFLFTGALGGLISGGISVATLSSRIAHGNSCGSTSSSQFRWNIVALNLLGA